MMFMLAITQCTINLNFIGSSLDREDLSTKPPGPVAYPLKYSCSASLMTITCILVIISRYVSITIQISFISTDCQVSLQLFVVVFFSRVTRLIVTKSKQQWGYYCLWKEADISLPIDLTTNGGSFARAVISVHQWCPGQKREGQKRLQEGKLSIARSNDTFPMKLIILWHIQREWLTDRRVSLMHISLWHICECM